MNLCVLLVDLDHLKKINAAHGHQAGDAVLKQAALLRLFENVLNQVKTSRHGMLIPCSGPRHENGKLSPYLDMLGASGLFIIVCRRHLAASGQ